jgi:hypothetical protein
VSSERPILQRWRLLRPASNPRPRLLPLCVRCGNPVLPAEQLEGTGYRDVVHRNCNPRGGRPL